MNTMPRRKTPEHCTVYLKMKVIEDYSITAVLLRLALGPCQLTSTNNGGNIVIGGEGEKGNDLENAAWTTIQAIATHWPLSLLTPHGAPS